MKTLLMRGSAWVAPVTGAAYFALWVADESQRSELPGNAAVFGLLALAIALAVWMPLTALGLTIAVPALQCLGLATAPTGTTWPAYGAVAIVAFFIGARAPRIAQFLSLPAFAVAGALMAWCIMVPTSPDGVTSNWFVFQTGSVRQSLVALTLAAFGSFAAAWAIGLALSEFLHIQAISRLLSTAESRWEETDLQLRVTQDRAQIARDVHDALAHSLAIIVSQAQGALALAPQHPAVATQSLENIGEVGRAALIDVRGLVERIQQDGDGIEPRAGLDDIPELIAHTRAAGVEASLETDGVPGILTSSQELAVFRIVQESLTNTLKHAGVGAMAAVALHWRTHGLSATIHSSRRPGAAASERTFAPGTGVGITGMIERARLAGGSLTAGPSNAADAAPGSFVVSAFIPADGDSADVAAAAATLHTLEEPADV